MAGAKGTECTLLPLEGNDKPLVVNVYVANSYSHEKKNKEEITTCISWGPPGHAGYAYWGRDDR